MHISEMIKNLKEFMDEHGDLECWYATDDEGNEYNKIHWAPSRYLVTRYGEVYQDDQDVLEYCDVDIKDTRPICIVN